MKINYFGGAIMHFVIVDFDGTIYLEETPRLFLNVLGQDKSRHKKVKKFYLSISWLYILYKLGACRELMSKKVILGIAKIIKGMNQREINDYFKACVEAAKEKFNPEILKRIQQHHQDGDEVLLLSGAFSPFLALVAKELGIKYWLGTELELTNGYYTGRVLSLLNGGKKVSALQLFLKEKEKAGLKLNLNDSYAYADSIRDLPILSLAGHPIAVNPDSMLFKEAVKNHWEIIQTE